MNLKTHFLWEGAHICIVCYIFDSLVLVMSYKID